MAHASAVYLLQILKQLQQSDQFSSAQSKIHHLHGKICSLKDFLEKNSSLEDDGESTDRLESEIRDALYEAEDIIEPHISVDFLLSSGSASSGGENRISSFCEGLQRVIQNIDSISQRTEKSREEIDMSIFCRDMERVIRDIDSIAQRTERFREKNGMSIFLRDLQSAILDIESIAAMTKKFTLQVGHDLIPATLLATTVAERREEAKRAAPRIVGRYDDINLLVDRLGGSALELQVVPICGIPGIGKSALAKAVYDNESIVSHFAIRAWIKVSREYHKRDILLGLLRSMAAVGGGMRQETDEQLAEYLYDSLRFRKYLVVLDDLCNVEAWNYLKELLPDNSNGSRVILTTRHMDVALADNNKPLHQVQELTEDKTWELLLRTVFADELCPPALEQIAKNIARDCSGLPLAIVTIGRVLAEANITGWQTAASSISTCKGHAELVEVVLSLNYRSLSQYLKACLLYMGIFPHNYEIPVSKLVKLWFAEGFLELDGSQTLEEMAEKILLQLVDRSLVLVCGWSSRGRIKTCMINDVYKDFVNGKAEEENFFQVLNKHTKGFLEDTRAHRRWCIPENICFGIADLEYYNSKPWVSTARSLLYSGPIYQHPLQVWLKFKLLRVLDALNIRFYSFPREIPKLVQLRYLAVTYNGELPESICELRNLQFLIVLRNLNIKRFGCFLHLPMKIWNMKELRQLRVTGRDLLDPSTVPEVGPLGNLLMLSDVSSHSCTPGVLRRIPNLKKLGIRIESPALDRAENFSFLSHLVILDHLESLKCAVMHPDLGSQIVPSISAFPPNLRKLCLSGCGFSWKSMKVISKLENLEVLKLQTCSFRGPNWKLSKEEFCRLKFLLLEDMDVARWIASRANFPSLARLIIRHCYKLRKIPYEIGHIATLEMIELDGCRPSVVSSVLRILELQRTYGNGLQVRIPSSWNNHGSRTFGI